MPRPMPVTSRAKEPLHERIKRMAAKSAPSMMPQEMQAAPEPVVAPPEKEIAVVPKLHELISDRKLSLELARKIQRLGEIARMKSALAKEEKPLKDWAKSMAGKYHISAAEAGDWRLSYYASPRATIKEELLVKALLGRGWQPKDIAKLLEESIAMSEGFTLKISALEAGEQEEAEAS